MFTSSWRGCLWDRRWLLVILGVGLALRLISVSVNYPNMRWQNDQRMSIPAVRMLEGKGLSLKDGAGPTAYRPPLYILWLAGVYAIFGNFSLVGPSLLQALVSTINIILLYLLARRVWKREDAALASAALLSIHPYTVYHDAALYHTFLSTALLLGGLTLLWKGVEEKRWPILSLSGALFGLCVLILSVIVPWLALLGVVAVIFWRIALLQRALLVGAFILGLALTWSPWILRNAVAFREFIPLTTESGVTLWMGNNPQSKELLKRKEHESSPVPQGTPFNLPEFYTACKPEGWCRGGVTESEENRALTKLAKDWIKAHPKEFIGLTVWRYGGIWSPFLTPAKSFGSSAAFNALVRYGYFAWNVVLYALIAIGIWLAWREKKYAVVLLTLALALGSTLAYALFLYYTKYRIPFEATLLPFAGAGLMWLFKRLAGRPHTTTGRS